MLGQFTTAQGYRLSLIKNYSDINSTIDNITIVLTMFTMALLPFDAK